MSAHLRLVETHHDPVRAAHANQFASRASGLSRDYYRRPWYTKKVWLWTAIAVLIVAVIGLALTGSDRPNF